MGYRQAVALSSTQRFRLPVDLPPAPFIESRLANGLRLLLHPDQGSPVVAVNLLYRVGSRYEEPGKTGYAHLFEHLLFDGSATLRRGEYDRYCTMVGGENNAWTSTDQTDYWILVPRERLELGLRLESDRMAGFGIEQISLDTQKSVVIAEKRQTIDNTPYGASGIEMRKLMFAPGHPYRHEPIGSMEDVAAATLDDMRGFYQRYYTPANAVLSISGGFDPDVAKELVERYFGPIPSAPPNPTADPDPALLRTGERIVIRDEITPLNGIFLGWHGPSVYDEERSDDLIAYELLASILAEGESSRLYRALEYELEIASETSAFVDEGELGSLFCLYAIAQNNDVGTARLEEELLRQLALVANEGVTERELQKAINKKATGAVHALQSASSIAERMAYFAAVFDDPALAWYEARIYEEVTIDRIVEAARRLIAISPSAVVYERA